MTGAESAAGWAEGRELLDPATLPDGWFELVAAVRRLNDVVVATDVDAATRVRCAADIDDITRRLATLERDPHLLVGRHADGRLDNLTQAGSGTLNPQAPDIEFVQLPPPPPAGSPPRSVEVVAVCRPTRALGGPPGKLHGGVVATLLDEVLGRALNAAGCQGLTAGLEVRYRAATPLDGELRIAARLTEIDGRKSRATGEITVDGDVTAEGTALFIGPRTD